jgi:tetratricopeptide (TPR) repeat protein
MSKTLIYILTILVLGVSCGTEKELTENKGSVSVADYPYIEKFHKALRFKSTGRHAEAVSLLEECLQLKQDDDAVYYALSKSELELGHADKSSYYIQKAAELDPDNLWYTQELAYMFFEVQQYDNSVENFKKLVDAEPRNVDWLYGYAEALVRAGQAEEAIEALRKTEEQIGRYPDIIVQRHKLYLSINKLEEAEKELLDAKEEFPKDPLIIATLVDFYFKNNREADAVLMLEELVKADPGNGRAHLTLADIYQRQGNEEKAYAELKLAFEAMDVDLDTKMRILIKIHEQVYKIDPVVYELVDIVVRQYPEEAKAHSIKGDYMLRAEKEDEALKSYKTALEYDKGQYPIWNQVLIMLYQNGDYKELEKYSTECIDYFPSISTVYLLNGVACNQNKNHDQALESLNFGLELIVNDEPMKAEFYGQIAEAHFGLGEDQTAIDKYKKAMEIAPESLLIKNNFAFQLAKNKVELELAESLISQVNSDSPGQPQFVDTYGFVYFMNGEYDKAKKKFERAYNIDPNDRVIIEHLGDVNYKLGDKDKALEWWERAVKMKGVSDLLKKKIADKKYYDPND